jgi:hypothetical protein
VSAWVQRRHVDAVTGERVKSTDPAAVWDEYETPVYFQGVSDPVWIKVDGAKVDEGEGTFPAMDLDYGELRKQAEAIRADRKKAKKAGRVRPTVKQKTPGVSETYRTAGKGAALFAGENSTLLESIADLDVLDQVRDLLDGFEVRRGRKRKDGTYKFVRLNKTAKGQEILDAFKSSAYAGTLEFLTWLFSQNRGKRWRDVDWAAVDELGEILQSSCVEEAQRTRMGQQCVGWEWYPPGAELRPLTERLSELPERAAKSYESNQHAERLRELVKRLRASLKKAAACLPPDTIKAIRRRINYLALLSREPWRIPAATICGADPSSGYQLCGFPAIEAEATQLKQACRVGYDPRWPLAESLSPDQAAELGLPVVVGREREGPEIGADEGPARTQAEAEAEPWPLSEPNPRKWSLVSAVAMAKKHPRTFKRPSAKKLAAIAPGDFVKAAFKASKGDKATERMWVIVTERDGDTLRGKLDNRPAFRGSGLRLGSRVELRLRDVYDVKKTNPDAQATPRKGGSKRKSTSSKAEPIRSRPNGAGPWGELLDLRARVIELEIETPRGVEVHTWHRDRPALFWSEKRRALVWVHGGKDPARWVDDAAKGPIASRHRQWHGDEPAERGEVEIPAGRLVKLGPALRIVYSAERYRDGVPRHHDFGADVAAYSQKGRGARVFSVRGGRLTLNDRGLVF